VPSDRAPEPIDLPDQPPPGGPPQTPPFTKRLPPMLALEQQREAHQAQFEEARRQQMGSLMQQIQSARGGSSVVVYYSTNILNDREVSGFYQLFAGVDRLQNLDLYLFSYGGVSTDAYKMVTLLRQHCDHLGVLIPYKAKSAATLLALGADELVMGPPSELGPIDPQIPVQLPSGDIVWVAAQAIQDGLKFFETRIKGNPERALLYAPLVRELNPYVVGQYERELASSKQFARDLLGKYMLKNDIRAASQVANRLTTGFYSHGHVIDRDVARHELKLNVTHPDTPLWNAMWELHNLYQVYLAEHPQLGGVAQAINAQIDLAKPQRPAPSPEQG
jgi:hypothetical protein